MSRKNKNNGCLKGCGIAFLVAIGFFIILMIIGVIATSIEDPYDYEKAIEFYENKEYTKANEQIDTLIVRDSINPSLLFLKGKIAFELEDTISSHQYMNQAIMFTDSIPLKFDMHNAIFNWNIEKKDTIRATKVLMETVPLFKYTDYKKYIDTHYRIATVFEEAKMSDRSRMVLNRLLDSISIKRVDTVFYQEAHYNVYDRLWKLHDTINALQTLEKVTKEIASSTIAYEKLGDFYRNKSQHKKAIKYYKNYLKVDTTNTAVYTSLGKSYRDIKYKKSAIKYFKIATRKGNSEACSELRELTARTKYYTESICCDGSRSSSTGRGTCSHHGGVCGVEYIPYKDYTMSCRN